MMAIMIISQRRFALHVDSCPLPARKWKEKPYANFIDDCTVCKYFGNKYDADKKYMICDHPNAKNQIS